MIKDSGNRTEFETGAVRDIQEGKGRCDLLPLDVVATGYYWTDWQRDIFKSIHYFQENGEVGFLYKALDLFGGHCWPDPQSMYLEVAIHFEEGAKKYGEYNWQKGIPVNRYIDSGIRHFLKWMRGDKDEAHDRAFVWNIICCIWEVEHHHD